MSPPPCDKAPSRHRPLPVVPFPATRPTSASISASAGSPLADDEDDGDNEVQFLGSRPVPCTPTIPAASGLEINMTARLTALRSINASSSTHILTPKNNGSSFDSRITTLENVNAALEAEFVIIKDRIRSLESQSSLNPQSSQSLPASTYLKAASVGRPTQRTITNNSEHRKATMLEPQTSLKLVAGMQAVDPMPKCTDRSNYSSKSFITTETDDLDRVSAVTAEQGVSQVVTRSNVSHEFTIFGQLPAELRTIIWKLATPESRVYSIRRPNNDHEYPYAAADVHSILLTCRESREIGKAMYEKNSCGFRSYNYCEAYDIIYLDSVEYSHSGT
ncbi:hypothetical protein ONS95_000750 [Cadophora gregata]|uniref:uncharacterized protein n=1 Tax=Cadophora gregata TaxID=51156 RepID=UPI0026DBB040|nr:uncharacterized protein ONS95_000750 [Cadophora gregata]KAK0103073.1 hypothetical protein ONS96_005684 [Cadophora gregata f. sp. sojae]KAK0128800.1 hypothetical protein ONS95_000750 [Cadophora gregata]